MMTLFPLIIQADEVVEFNAKTQVTVNSPNEIVSFALDPAIPLVTSTNLEGYSGPDIYGAMNKSGSAYWRIAENDASGLSVRLNESAGSWVDGLFLMPVESVRFNNENNTFYALDIHISQAHRLDSAILRFVLRADGKFYISEPTQNMFRGGQGHMKDTFMLNVLTAKWFSYDPTASPESVSIIGSPASPKFADIDFVGFALFAKGADDAEGVNFGVRIFSVDAKK